MNPIVLPAGGLAPILALSAFPCLAPATQVGGPPIPPIGAASLRFLSRVLVDETGGRTQVLVSEHQASRRVARIFEMDPAGDLTLVSSRAFPEGSPFAFGEDRMVSRDNYSPDKLRISEWNGSDWTSYEIEQAPLFHSVPYGYSLAIHGQTILVSDTLNSEVDVYDLSTLGAAVLVDEFAVPAGKIAAHMKFDGSTAVVLAAVRELTGLSGAELLTYRYSPGSGFVFESSIQLGPQYDLNQLVGLDIRGPEIALGFPNGTSNSSCGRVLVLTRTGSSYVPGPEIVSPEPCQSNPSNTSAFGWRVELGSAGEVFIQGGPVVGMKQYVRSASGQWTASRRHLTEGSGGSYALARDWVVGVFPQGLQVFDLTSSLATDALVCAATIPSAEEFEWALGFDGSYSLASQEGRFLVTFETDLIVGDGVMAPALLLIGDQRGHRVLGPMATICLGGHVQRRMMDLTGGGFNSLGMDARVDFDPNGLGVMPGDTLLFQAWARPPAGDPAGATTSAKAITFIP